MRYRLMCGSWSDMTALYLLEPDPPATAWSPFAGATALSELRAGGWAIAERWGRALGIRSAAGVLSSSMTGPRPAGALPVAVPTTIRGPAWVADATFCPRLPMRATGAAKRLLFEGRTVAWRLDAGEAWQGTHTSGDGVVIEGLPLRGAWDLVTALERFLFDDTLSELERGTDPLPAGVVVLGNPGAVANRTADVEPGVVLDVRKGAIILERGVVVKSGARLEGPCWIREGTIVSGGQLRHVSAGPHCRLHGEISTTTFTGYANKSHDGFVGHSVVGAWANLGAGTITSNLKNTYGQVRVESAGQPVDTGRMMLGALIGDHAKTAIGTLLPTGAVVGAGANLFGAVRATKYTAPFAWGDTGETLDADRFIAVARRVLPRRDVPVDTAMEASLRAMHARMTKQ
jgi:UDP-N-acetylglucosamine diphosphorylase/glucosamine-1-phosphate N-acetyltransferase